MTTTNLHLFPDAARITPHTAATTLWHYGAKNPACVPQPPAIPPSEWRRLLLELIGKSDPANRLKLAAGFPGEVAAVDLIEKYTRGTEILRRIANSWTVTS